MGLLPCPLPFHSHTNSHHSNLHCYESSSFSSSSSALSSSSSLSSQPSLPSVPSLTPQPPLTPPQPPSAAARHLCLATLEGHSSYVSSLALSDKSLLSTSADGEVRSWSRHLDANSHQSDSRADNNSNNIVAVTDSAVKDVVVLGDRLVTAHQDHKIRVWKADDDGRDQPDRQVYKLVTTLPTLADRLARIFSAKNYVEVRRHKKSTWVHHVDAVSGLALSPDHSLLYSVSWDRTLKVWRTSDFKCLESINKAHDDAINAVVVSPSHDRLVYTGSADTKIKVWAWSRAEGKAHGEHGLVATLEKHRSAVNALAISGDGRVLYSGACDRSILVWEREGGDGTGGGEPLMVVVGALRGHSKAILCLTIVSDLVISGSADKTVRIWQREQGRSYSCLAVLEGHNRPVKCIAAASAGEDDGSSGGPYYIVYSGSLDGSIKVWQVQVHSM